MAVTYLTPTITDEGGQIVRVSSSGTAPITFRFYREGGPYSEIVTPTGVTTAEMLFHIGGGESPFIEATDDTAEEPEPAFPGRWILHWQAITGAVSYTIEEYVSSVWTERGSVPDRGEGSFTWITRWLEDATTHQFRVKPIDSGGNAGTAKTFTAEMRRHPDLPSTTITVGSGGELTIT